MRALALLLLLLSTPAMAQVPKVETDIPPIAALVAQVMGDLGTPGMLLDKGGDEHDLQLRPSQMRDLNSAQLLVWVGPALTPGLQTALDATPNLQSLTLLDDPVTKQIDYTEGGQNPHAWLDPTNASAWAGLIADRLAMLDPENAATYKANAAAAQTHIAELDADIARQLAALTQTFVTYHDAYGYFTNHYNLTSAGGLAAGDAAPPGAASLSDLRAKATDGTIACAFPEAQHDPALIVNLAEGTSVFIGPPLDPVGSTLDPTPQAYATLLTNLTKALLTCADRP